MYHKRDITILILCTTSACFITFLIYGGPYSSCILVCFYLTGEPMHTLKKAMVLLYSSYIIYCLKSEASVMLCC